MRIAYRPTTDDGYRRYFAMETGLAVPFNLPISWLSGRDLLDVPEISAWHPEELAGTRGWHPRLARRPHRALAPRGPQ